MAKGEQHDVLDPQIQQILDRAGVTSQQLFGGDLDVHDAAVSTTADGFATDLHRATRPNWFPTLFRQIDAKTFCKTLEAQLDPLTVGYSYRLMKGGRQVGGKSSYWAQLPAITPFFPDDGSVNWRFSVPMNTGSVSKFITAVALYRLLADRSIPITTSIVNFVPAYWQADSSVNQVSFRMLLRHTSGLGQEFNIPPTSVNAASINTSSGPGDIASARVACNTGSSLDAAYDYKNINYIILRVAFAILAGVPRTLDQQSSPVNIDTLWDLVSANAYANYVNDVLFGPANIAPRNFVADVDAAKGYGTPPIPPGTPSGDATAGAGSTGWHLTIGELTRLIDAVRRGKSILSQKEFGRVLASLYGLDAAETTDAGLVYRKGGRTLFGTNQGMDSAIYIMPNDLELAIFVNSVPPSPPAPPAPAPGAPPPSPPTWPSHLDGIMNAIRSSIYLGI